MAIVIYSIVVKKWGERERKKIKKVTFLLPHHQHYYIQSDPYTFYYWHSTHISNSNIQEQLNKIRGITFRATLRFYIFKKYVISKKVQFLLPYYQNLLLPSLGKGITFRATLILSVVKKKKERKLLVGRFNLYCYT